uniref:Plasmid pRiA4b ORF-3 family protein n=1 Tax=Caulobacter sp. (strain K31) TaxID=366602 RepID=B0T9Z8_CAUSK
MIWRQVEAPTSITLKVLHDIIQQTIGWFDYHLWEFTIGKRRYGLPMDEDWGTTPRKEAAKVRLRDVLEPKTTVIDYVNDFGDNWEHRITVTDVRVGDPQTAYPRYIGGEGSGPPEDCGGVPGFYEMLEARGDPDHPNHAQAAEWLDDYDPDVIDEEPIKYALSAPDHTLFRSGRQFAAWLGLTPRANSSGGKERLGGISKMGDGYLRRLLVVGATAVIRMARQESYVPAPA